MFTHILLILNLRNDYCNVICFAPGELESPICGMLGKWWVILIIKSKYLRLLSKALSYLLRILEICSLHLRLNALLDVFVIEVVKHTITCHHQNVMLLHGMLCIVSIVRKLAVGATLVWEVELVLLLLRFEQLGEIPIFVSSEDVVTWVTQVCSLNMILFHSVEF